MPSPLLPRVRFSHNQGFEERRRTQAIGIGRRGEEITGSMRDGKEGDQEHTILGMDNAKTLTRSSLHFLSGTMLSRISGMGRDMLTAFCFGTDPAIAAFLVAFRLSNLLRRIFGEGALTVGFIPHFEALQAESPKRAAGFFRDLIVSMSLVLIGVIVAIEIGLLSTLNWGGFSDDNGQILSLTALMMPGLLFICLSAVFSALLQCEHSFFLSGVSPVAFNVIWMGAVWLLRDEPPVAAAKGLAISITLAFFMQWIVLLPKSMAILRRSMALGQWLHVKLFSPELRMLATSLSLGVIGVGAIQVNSAIDALFARHASLEGPAYLTYAIRLQQLPMALFAIAISSAALPALSRAMAAGDRSRFLELLRFALLRTFCLVFPCTLAIFSMGGAAVNLIFGRGHFQGESVVHTTTCLFGYALGLVPASFVVLLASALYSRKDYRTPTVAAGVSMAVNIVLNALLVFGLQWGAQSVAVATSIAAFCNAWMLSRALGRKVGQILPVGALQSYIKPMSCSAVACVVSLAIGDSFFADPTLPLLLHGAKIPAFPTEWRQQLLHFVALCGSFGVVLLASAWWSRTDQLLGLIGLGHLSAKDRR